MRSHACFQGALVDPAHLLQVKNRTGVGLDRCRDPLFLSHREACPAVQPWTDTLTSPGLGFFTQKVRIRGATWQMAARTR